MTTRSQDLAELRKVLDLADRLIRELGFPKPTTVPHPPVEKPETAEDVDFRIEVIEALVAKGVARHVAAARTKTEAGLLAAAKEVGIL